MQRSVMCDAGTSIARLLAVACVGLMLGACTKCEPRFEVHIEKARTLVGEGAAPFEAAVEAFTTETGQAAIRWTARDLKPSVYEQATTLFQEGRSVRQVKTLLNISRGEADRLRLRAAAEGLLD